MFKKQRFCLCKWTVRFLNLSLILFCINLRSRDKAAIFSSDVPALKSFLCKFLWNFARKYSSPAWAQLSRSVNMLHQVENQRRVSSVACLLERVAEQRRLSVSGVFTPPQGRDRRLSTLLSHGTGYYPGINKFSHERKGNTILGSRSDIGSLRFFPGQNSFKWKVLL